jgi:uncharacterized protein (DUF362 family)
MDKLMQAQVSKTDDSKCDGLNSICKSDVGIIHDEMLSYPAFPYNPSEKYPELGDVSCDSENSLYGRIRELLYNIGLDKDNFDTPLWNPLGDLISPGQTVIVKPNWVLHFNPKDKSNDSLVTHTSVIRVILDYICIALNNSGTVVIADAPLQTCDFDKLMQANKTGDLLKLYIDKYDGIGFSIRDLRKTVLKSGESATHFKADQMDQAGDPEGYSLIDIAGDSLLMDIIDRSDRFRVTCYDHKLLAKHHNSEKNEYLVANSILKSDVIINIGKMKCHKKAGLTGAMKSLIGMNGHKEYLPHHITGSEVEGGDQYIYPSWIKDIYNKVYDYYWSSECRTGRLGSKILGMAISFLSKFAKLIARDDNLEGSWYGNDTIPRTTIDLNNIAYFYDLNDMKLKRHCQRPSLHIIDGIVAGEGNGPITPRSKNAGVVMGGFNPALVDHAMARLMGYNPMRIKSSFYSIHHNKSLLGLAITEHNLDKINYNGNQIKDTELPNLKFIKPRHWQMAE